MEGILNALKVISVSFNATVIKAVSEDYIRQYVIQPWYNIQMECSPNDPR